MFYDRRLTDDEIYLEVEKLICGDGDNPPAYHFYIRSNIDDKKMGKCSFRVGNAENRHIKYGGNIGYDIDEPYRGKKYSLKAAKLMLTLAKFHNLKSVLIACAPENIASCHICELLGAKLIAILDLPKDDYNYMNHGARKHCIYEITI